MKVRNGRRLARKQTKPNQRMVGYTKSRFSFFSLPSHSVNKTCWFKQSWSVSARILVALQKLFWAILLWVPAKMKTNNLRIKGNIFSRQEICGCKKCFVRSKIAFKFALFVSCKMSCSQNFQMSKGTGMKCGLVEEKFLLKCRFLFQRWAVKHQRMSLSKTPWTKQQQNSMLPPPRKIFVSFSKL